MKEPLTFIGGLGGSGTRVVAHILNELDVYLGCDLNVYFDNLLFTRLFKNPLWYQYSSRSQKSKRIILFQKIMLGIKLSAQEKGELKNATRHNTLIKTRWYNRLTKKPPRKLPFWAWKEPNSHVYLNQILTQYPSTKYIHVSRNSWQMLNSSNKQQLKIWAKVLFDFQDDSNDQVRYWLAVNERILSISNDLKNNRIYFCNFDQLCRDPKKVISQLISFLELRVSKDNLQNLCEIPRIPKMKVVDVDDVKLNYTYDEINRIEYFNNLSGVI